MKNNYLTAGDVIEIKKGMRVYAPLPDGRLGLTDAAEGEYAVVTAGSTGQGSGYDGSVDAALIYPDGYKVVCRKLKDGKYDPEGSEITFYQSGCFSAIHSPAMIRPVRKISL